MPRSQSGRGIPIKRLSVRRCGLHVQEVSKILQLHTDVISPLRS